MPVVINSLDVSPEPTRSAAAEAPAAQPEGPRRPDPEEIRRQLERMAERMLRLLAH
jgi:hypothetical protein